MLLLWIRTDGEKAQSNWTKAIGLTERGEYSHAIVRAATMLEIITNAVLRKELLERHKLPNDMVDHLLKWANGINGKWQNLLLPLAQSKRARQKVNKLFLSIKEINRERNEIVHGGSFRKEMTAKKVLDASIEVVNQLICHFDLDFEISSPSKTFNKAIKKAEASSLSSKK